MVDEFKAETCPVQKRNMTDGKENTLKILIDTDVLLNVATHADPYPEDMKLINDLTKWDDASLWISAGSLIKLEGALNAPGHEEKTADFMNFVQDAFSIIPFRKSVFSGALVMEGFDFEDRILLAGAREWGMDLLVTRGKDRFKEGEIPVLTPLEFLEKRNAGEFDKVSHVPFLDLKAQHSQVYNEIDDRMTDIIANTGFILGKHVEAFEEGFARAQEAKYCLGVSSGTDALHVALLALGIGPGDRVLVPVNTFMATAEAVSLTGAEPVFVDCDRFFNMDTAHLKTLLSEMSEKPEATPKAVIPVHLYGQPAHMDEVMSLADQYGLNVVEDCAQAHLARYQRSKKGSRGKDVEWRSVGSDGAFGAFSFYPGKNLGAYGEAGALVTNDPELFERARMFRQHGEIKRYHHQVVGHNYRMEAFQGAVLSTKLKYLKEWTEKRRKNARLYSQYLKGIEGVETPLEREGTECVYHLYVIQTDHRDGLQKYLGDHHIASGLHYPLPLHLQEAYGFLGYKNGDFPSAETSARRILSLPMYPEMTENQIQYVCEKIKAWVETR